MFMYVCVYPKDIKGTVRLWEAFQVFYYFTVCEIMRIQSFTEISKFIEAHG